MANKVEFFKAVDRIDGAPSFFAIQSIDGKDIGHNVILSDGILKLSDLVGRVVSYGKCSHPDFSLEPRRRDMVDPVLLYTLVIEKDNS
jgi:hypothetical protein